MFVTLPQLWNKFKRFQRRREKVKYSEIPFALPYINKLKNKGTIKQFLKKKKMGKKMENPILQGDGDTKWARKDKRT